MAAYLFFHKNPGRTLILLHKQKQALINAKSISTRIFRKEEHADQHCQIGNLNIALETMVNWIEKYNPYILNGEKG